jgi:hypothetical protein
MASVKAEKRARDEGKRTIFFNRELQIAPGRIENFKKRKTEREATPVSPGAGMCLPRRKAIKS